MAANQCSFLTTGTEYSEQEWYECRTCGLDNGSGVCVSCTKVCHRGHRLSEAKFSRFYCDCGAGGGCKAMGKSKKRRNKQSNKNANVSRSLQQQAPQQQQQQLYQQVQQQQQVQTQQQNLQSLSQFNVSVMQQRAREQQVAAPQLIRGTSYVAKEIDVGSSAVIQLPPLYFVHILNTNTNVTRVEVGPQTITRMDHEKLVNRPCELIVIPQGHYCIIADPVICGDDGEPLVDKNSQFRQRFGDYEVRTNQPPFPLFPGESVSTGVTPLQSVPENCALRLKALRDVDGHSAGDEWYFMGPATYVPRIEIEPLEMVSPIVIQDNQALRLKATTRFVDRGGNTRSAGEEWLIRENGFYLPDVFEEIVGLVDAQTLTETTAVHVRALRTFTDVFGKARKAGSEWLITYADTDSYLPDVNEEVLGLCHQTIVKGNEYCVVLDPVVKGVQAFGTRQLRTGPRTFFLQPGEALENGIQPVYVLSDREALVIRASEAFTDEDVDLVRKPGDRWLVEGPRDYVPPVQVTIEGVRESIPLDANEGVYVRDTQTGAVRAVVGETYMLREYEELWDKDLPADVAGLLGVEDRVASTVVTYRVPHNCVCQVYDYRNKTSRIVFGPDLVLLAPDEQFTRLSLSGGKPKRNNQIRDIKLMLGPDFMTDIMTVETSDHARLSLKLSYSWFFDLPSRDPIDAARVFQVPDFVGDACKAVASRVRGAVASVPFDEFHRHSADVIRTAVFGREADGSIRTEFRFKANSLVINAVDIQTVEPVDQKTRDALQKSVQMAIAITTSSQEAEADHESNRLDQISKAALAKQSIQDQAAVEKSRRELLALQAQSAAIETTGTAKAEAIARAEAAEIEGKAAVLQAKLKAKAANIESASELKRSTRHQNAELNHQQQMDELQIAFDKKMAAVSTTAFKDSVGAIGSDTIEEMARAGPEQQAQLLQSLGLEGFLVTDGSSPINLLNTANGLIGNQGAPGTGPAQPVV